MRYIIPISLIFSLTAFVIAIYQFTDNRADDGGLSLLFGLVFLNGVFYNRYQLIKTGRKKTNP